MSLAELFYCREALRTRVKRWHSKRQPSRQQFMLEALEPRLLLSATPAEIVVNQEGRRGQVLQCDIVVDRLSRHGPSSSH